MLDLVDFFFLDDPVDLVERDDLLDLAEAVDRCRTTLSRSYTDCKSGSTDTIVFVGKASSIISGESVVAGILFSFHALV